MINTDSQITQFILNNVTEAGLKELENNKQLAPRQLWLTPDVSTSGDIQNTLNSLLSKMTNVEAAITELTTSLNNHKHDSDYLKLSGGTITASSTITMGGTSNSTGAKLKWGTVNSKTPYIGYATDQTDGTFLLCSLTGTTYATGLAIGGGSGNLLWKGVKVVTTSDLPTNHVDTSSNQSIAGTKTFTGSVVVPDVTIS